MSPSESAKANSAAQTRMRIDAPNSRPRVVKAFPLDAGASAQLADLAERHPRLAVVDWIAGRPEPAAGGALADWFEKRQPAPARPATFSKPSVTTAACERPATPATRAANANFFIVLSPRRAFARPYLRGLRLRDGSPRPCHGTNNSWSVNWKCEYSPCVTLGNPIHHTTDAIEYAHSGIETERHTNLCASRNRLSFLNFHHLRRSQSHANAAQIGCSPHATPRALHARRP